MLELQQRTMTDPTLVPDTTTTTTDTDLEEHVSLVEQMLKEDREYMLEDDVEEVDEEAGKDEQELDEDLNSLEPASLELEEMSVMHEDLTQLQGSHEMEADAILLLPHIAHERETTARRTALRRRRSACARHC